ncbi:amine oxidase [Burkholderia cepacia]|uniref:Amine oxidase n=1 Tax=Burkholderia cepacia TaxID=292 RepID=A0A103ZZI5_BURCE|nr:FAD-dependent oxidoreductase [Burkholderia cepacia]KVK88946.1 amine oxidase [Burkholderia cepacia]
METTRIVIVGAGLSGLYAAYLLEQQGIGDYVLLEARARPGGRIMSASRAGAPGPMGVGASNNVNRFDLGPTWFWPDLQPRLDRLVRRLGLERFAQHETGDMLVERVSNEPPMRMRGYAALPRSMRLVGGMGALTDALQRSLPTARLAIGKQVRQIRRTQTHVELDAGDSEGQVTTYRAELVLLAVPPRLAVATIEFAPALPDALQRSWNDTATWMAPHAKYLAVYDTPFWRERGLSGEARSTCGPLVEIHDASMPGGDAALFGFVGMSAQARKRLSYDELCNRCREQLTRMFGSQALRPREEIIKDWAEDPLTATESDQNGGAGHPAAPAARAESGVWRDALIGIASEWSLQFPGYVAGAIDAASMGVSAVLGLASFDAISAHRRCN